MEDLKIYNTLDSTNLEARRLLAAGPVADGTALIALEQTAGRGQLNRVWHAQPGLHLAMTLILTPNHLETSHLPEAGMKISLAIIHALKRLAPGLHPEIKWPNDILVHGRKLCGILIENTIAGSRVQHLIAGIGLNVNETQFPPELPDAVSLYQLTGKHYDLLQGAGFIREEIMHIFKATPAGWKKMYDSCLFGVGHLFSFLEKGKTINATVLGVDEQGRIVLGTGENEIKAYYTHEIKWNL